MTGEWDGLVVAVNDIGVHWPGEIDAWASLHPEKFKRWVLERREKGHPDGYFTWGSGAKKSGKVDRTIKTWAGGSSGMLGVTVALDGLKVERVVLAGVPMDKQPHFAESTVHSGTRAWGSADGHWKWWKSDRALPKMEGKVKSMSGRTAELLGEPTVEWLGVETREAA